MPRPRDALLPNHVPPLKITNLVCTVYLGLALFVEHVNMVLHGKYDPAVFPAAVSRSLHPRCTNSIAKSGRIVVTGARTEWDALLNVYRLVAKLRRDLHIDVQVYNFKVENIVGTLNMGFRINTDLFYADQQDFCSYDPTNFPGVIWRPKNTGIQPKMTYTIYQTGKVVMPGLLSVINGEKARQPLLCLYRYREGKEYRKLEAGRKRNLDEFEVMRQAKLQKKTRKKQKKQKREAVAPS
jgi:transcription initiation factor TFIID TATA-box-binding protein